MSERTVLHRVPSRGSHDVETIYSILDAGFLAHVGFQCSSQPFVVPTLYARDGDRLYMHGSTASRMLGALGRGVPACVTVTMVDGLVLARSAFHHSMNYRSVMAFGNALRVDDPARKLQALHLIADHLMENRWEDVRSPTEKELEATAVLEFLMEDASAKIRQGPPIDDEQDYSLPVWAGVLPFRLEAKPPIPDPRLAAGTEVPPYVLRCCS